jgi:hypothetical protein
LSADDPKAAAVSLYVASTLHVQPAGRPLAIKNPTILTVLLKAGHKSKLSQVHHAVLAPSTSARLAQGPSGSQGAPSSLLAAG